MQARRADPALREQLLAAAREYDRVRYKRRAAYRKKYEREYHHRRKVLDEGYVIARRIRARLTTVLRNYTKTGKITRARTYGVDYAAIIARLGPCPGLRAEWHIDHVRPLSSFDLSDPMQLAAAFAPKNLQWLPATENILKGSRCDWSGKQ
jgi:hypothetical protein